MKIKNRSRVKIAGVLALIIIFAVAGVFIHKTYAYNARIKVLEETIADNKQQIVNIDDTKELLHILAENFREGSLYDENFETALKNKWRELDLMQQNLVCDNEKFSAEIEEKKSKRVNLGTFELTAYCYGNVTSTGTTPTANRTIAVDPKVIPYGSVVEIEGYGTYVAEDCGGAVKGNIIDIYIPGYDNCIKFGRRKANVYMIKE